MAKSSDCLDNNHGLCKGFYKETFESRPVTRICMCPCHDSTYQLIRNTVALVNASERNNPYQFTQAGYDDDRM